MLDRQSLFCNIDQKQPVLSRVSSNSKNFIHTAHAALLRITVPVLQSRYPSDQRCRRPARADHWAADSSPPPENDEKKRCLFSPSLSKGISLQYELFENPLELFLTQFYDTSNRSFHCALYLGQPTRETESLTGNELLLFMASTATTSFSPAIELDDHQHSQPSPEEDEIVPSPSQYEPQMQSLPPTDHGRGAYTALACCTIAQAPIWGKFHHYQPYNASIHAPTNLT
jgi:hypothetical protein